MISYKEYSFIIAVKLQTSIDHIIHLFRGLPQKQEFTRCLKRTKVTLLM